MSGTATRSAQRKAKVIRRLELVVHRRHHRKAQRTRRHRLGVGVVAHSDGGLRVTTPATQLGDAAGQRAGFARQARTAV